MSEEEAQVKQVEEENDSGSDVENEVANAEAEKKVDEPITTEDADMDETEEDKKQRACRQIEFYFSDSNLPYDRFMWTLHTANAEHWVPIQTVASFKRMREFHPFGIDWVTEALKLSEELEVDESNKNVRRRNEVKEPKGQFERSIYAKGFGKEEPGMQQKLEKYFNKFGRVAAVRMRRVHDTKEFKGSVFVEFSDMSTVERFLKLDPKPTWNGHELLIMSKETYCDMKIKEKGLTGKAASRKREYLTGSGRQGFNAFKLMQGEDKDDGKDKKEKEKAKPEIYLEFMGKKLRVHDEDGGKVDENEVPYVKGSALKFTGEVGELRYEAIKNPLKERFGRPPFIKYEKGNNWGLVGFDRALSEEDITYIKENLKTINDKEVTWTSAEESEEKQFLIDRAQSAAKKALSTPSNKGGKGARGGRGGGRGGRGGRGGAGRGGGRGDSGRAKPASTTKADENNQETKTDSPPAADAQVGEKRKRAVEPDGGPNVGIRGAGVPVIQSKKSKTEGESAS